ncbi:MAG TPA: 30S ribosome-binding factor RbfA [Chitinophagales bacterium]
MDSRRQSKIGSLMKETMTEILFREGRNIYGTAMVSVTNAWVSSDLSLARFYFSIYNTENNNIVLAQLNEAKPVLKRALVAKTRDLRKMPEFEFYLDDTLEQAAHIEKLFKKIHEEDEKIKKA